jgi:hypothetical protein
MEFKNMGYNIMTKTQFDILCNNENNEINEYYNQEKFEELNVAEHIDYDCNIINEIIKDENKNVCDIDYENNDINLSYLDWFYRKDYIDGMNWYIKKYPSMPFIENLSYFMVKKDLTGKSKLDKWEKTLIKNEIKKEKQYYSIIEKDRKKCIKKLIKEKNEPLKKIKFVNKKTILKF